MNTTRHQDDAANAGHSANPLAVVTGASTGIGYELARQCIANGFELLIAADEPAIHEAAQRLRAEGATVEALEANLATTEGIDKLRETVGSRPIGALLANAGRGLGHAFADQNFEDIRYVPTSPARCT